jgi:tetrahydromethanopterin S-methyltransferase subunit D
MGFILAGVVAAVVSLFLNRLALRLVGERAVVYVIPVIEEVVKASMAFLFSTSFIATYLLFGTIEGFYDFFNNQEKGLKIVFVSILGHTIFGYVFFNISRGTRSMLIGIGAATFLHMIWNALVLKAVSEEAPSSEH